MWTFIPNLTAYLQVYEYGQRNGNVRFEMLPYDYQLVKNPVKTPSDDKRPLPTTTTTTNSYSPLAEDNDDDANDEANKANKDDNINANDNPNDNPNPNDKCDANDDDDDIINADDNDIFDERAPTHPTNVVNEENDTTTTYWFEMEDKTAPTKHSKPPSSVNPTSNDNGNENTTKLFRNFDVTTIDDYANKSIDSTTQPSKNSSDNNTSFTIVEPTRSIISNSSSVEHSTHATPTSEVLSVLDETINDITKLQDEVITTTSTTTVLPSTLHEMELLITSKRPATWSADMWNTWRAFDFPDDANKPPVGSSYLETANNHYHAVNLKHQHAKEDNFFSQAPDDWLPETIEAYGVAFNEKQPIQHLSVLNTARQHYKHYLSCNPDELQRCCDSIALTLQHTSDTTTPSTSNKTSATTNLHSTTKPFVPYLSDNDPPHYFEPSPSNDPNIPSPSAKPPSSVPPSVKPSSSVPPSSSTTWQTKLPSTFFSPSSYPTNRQITGSYELFKTQLNNITSSTTSLT